MTSESDILGLKIVIINEMHRRWKISYDKLSDLIDEYEVLPYIEVSYDYFNSMGMTAILREIKAFIIQQGGAL